MQAIKFTQKVSIFGQLLNKKFCFAHVTMFVQNDPRHLKIANFILALANEGRFPKLFHYLYD